MSLYVLDTDTQSLAQNDHAAVGRMLLKHDPDDIAITVLTVEEQLSGWYARLRNARSETALVRAYESLASNVEQLADLRVLRFNEHALRLLQQLKFEKVRIGAMDLRIAATVIVHGATLVTRNRRDFEQVPGLVIEDWSL